MSGIYSRQIYSSVLLVLSAPIAEPKLAKQSSPYLPPNSAIPGSPGRSFQCIPLRYPGIQGEAI
jgi:hypothetical protein